MAKKPKELDLDAEPIMRRNLITLASEFAAVRGIAVSSVSQYAHGDRRFIQNLKAKKVSFTARKYDLMVAYFRTNWPEDAPFPQLEAVPCLRL